MEPNQHVDHNLSRADSNVGQYEFILNWYKINGKALLDEETLSNLSINTLLKILGDPIWNDIYHCWAIEKKHIPALQTYAKHIFKLDTFTYFIEVYHHTR